MEFAFPQHRQLPLRPDLPIAVSMGIFAIAGVAFVLEFIFRRIETVLVPRAGRE